MAKHKPAKFKSQFSRLLSSKRKKYKNVSWDYTIGRPCLYLENEDGSVTIEPTSRGPKKITQTIDTNELIHYA